MANHLRLASSSARPMEVANIASLFNASMRNGEAPALLVCLAALVPCSADALASAPIELIDREEGLLRVADPSGNLAEVALSLESAFVVELACIGRTEGPLVADCHGQAMVPDGDTLDFLKEVLINNDGKPLPFDWDFRSLREGVFACMSDGDVPQDVMMAQAGLGRSYSKKPVRQHMLKEQRHAAEWWSSVLGAKPPSPFKVLRALCLLDMAGSKAPGEGDHWSAAS